MLSAIRSGGLEMTHAQIQTSVAGPKNQLGVAAKYGAVGILGFLAGAGTLWSVSTREPAAVIAAQQPAPIQLAPIQPAPIQPAPIQLPPILVQPPQVVIQMPAQGSPSASPQVAPVMNAGDAGDSSVMGPQPSPGAPELSGATPEMVVPVVMNPAIGPLETMPTPAPVATTPARTAKVNINTATAEQFEMLPGIGPALAGRIVAHRTAHGRFRSITDLDKVDGIGPKTLERLSPLVTVD